MGNCLSSQSADDLSLLNESEGASLPGEPPPPYREHEQVPVYHPTPSQSRLATQLTEEEQIRIAQRIGLIQHLPKGIYDPGSEPSEKKVKDDDVLDGELEREDLGQRMLEELHLKTLWKREMLEQRMMLVRLIGKTKDLYRGSASVRELENSPAPSLHRQS